MGLIALLRRYALFVAAILASVCVFLIVGNFLALAAEPGGCPPNETCPKGWEPRPVQCTTNACDKVVPSGYCILCAPIPKPQ